MGRHRKDPELIAIEGGGTGGRRKYTDRPMKAPQGIPPMPNWLLPAAKREWRRVLPLLKESLSHLDMVALAMYCQSYAHLQALEKQIAKDGYMLETYAGNAVSPLVRAANKYAAETRACAEKLGLSPKDRPNIKVPLMKAVSKPDPDDDLFD
jgi:P27 family predicted phage terminase small subunit